MGPKYEKAAEPNKVQRLLDVKQSNCLLDPDDIHERAEDSSA
jgi:hypothetical protein